jgi:hypothetical protein
MDCGHMLTPAGSPVRIEDAHFPVVSFSLPRSTPTCAENELGVVEPVARLSMAALPGREPRTQQRI